VSEGQPALVHVERYQLPAERWAEVDAFARREGFRPIRIVPWLAKKEFNNKTEIWARVIRETPKALLLEVLWTFYALTDGEFESSLARLPSDVKLYKVSWLSFVEKNFCIMTRAKWVPRSALQAEP
jgi:hypothetical protein